MHRTFPERLCLVFGRKPRLARLQALADPPHFLDLFRAQSMAPILIRNVCKKDTGCGVLILCGQLACLVHSLLEQIRHATH